LERFAPWLGRVHLVTMRPQVPLWLDARKVDVVHHDQLFSPEHLPSFNSFAIVSHLVDIPELSPRFLYLEDDRLFLAPVTPEHFVTTQGKLRLYTDGEATPSAQARRARGASPWNLALAEANHQLDQRYGYAPRPSVKKAPLWIERAHFERFRTAFPEALSATRASKFRAAGNVASEHMYPWFLFHEGLAEAVPTGEARRALGYFGLERHAVYNALGLALLRYRRPPFVCLNDNFGARPPARSVAVARRFLQNLFPEPSRYELAP